MIINPSFDTENIFDEYPLLAEIVALFPDKDIVWHKYFRYLALCYDPGSPLVRKYDDIRTRKRFAAQQVEYEGEHYPEIAIEFIQRVIKSMLHTELYTNEQVFLQVADRAMRPIDKAIDEDKEIKATELKDKLLKLLGDIRERIASLRLELFSNDDDLNQQYDMELTAENVAKKMSNVSKGKR